MKPKQTGAEARRKGTGLVLSATTAAFTPARAATSHLRKRYREKYLGRSQRSVSES
jgi:alkaline phosphatase